MRRFRIPGRHRISTKFRLLKEKAINKFVPVLAGLPGQFS